MNKKVAFITLGCKTNQYETNAMSQKLIEAGYTLVKQDEKADIYVINTCTVTNMSDRKSRQMLRKMREQNLKALIVAVGCYAQVAKEEVEKIEEIDLVLGNNEKVDVVEHISNYLNEMKETSIISDIMETKEFQDFGETVFTERKKALIKIQDGCENYCSYCIIPYARGKVRSRKPQNVVSEITEIVKAGPQEIVLTGINITSYGKDFENKYGLIDLLKEIDKIEKVKQIELGSLEPQWITEQAIQELSNIKKIYPHFHISLQSSCDETLKRMNRKYTTREVESIVKAMRETFIDVTLTADIIVGFPGETEEEFESTYLFLKKIKLNKIHVFPYSIRKGTKAAEMKEQIDAKVKKERVNKIIEGDYI